MAALTASEKRAERNANIIALSNEGNTDAQIAKELGVSVSTVKRAKSKSKPVVEEKTEKTSTTTGKKEAKPASKPRWNAKKTLHNILSESILSGKPVLLRYDGRTFVPLLSEDYGEFLHSVITDGSDPLDHEHGEALKTFISKNHNELLNKTRSDSLLNAIHNEFSIVDGKGSTTVHNGDATIAVSVYEDDHEDGSTMLLIAPNEVLEAHHATSEVLDPPAPEITHDDAPRVSDEHEVSTDTQEIHRVDDENDHTDDVREWARSHDEHAVIGDEEEYAYVQSLSEEDRWKYEMNKRKSIRFTTALSILLPSIAFILLLSILVITNM
jgi:transcriptional regulator with PAS, ATPase and Fis domain